MNKPRNQEAVINRTRQRRKADPAYYLWSKARTRARARELAFEISPEDVKIPKRCPILGFKMKVLAKDRRRSATLDRIIPSLGYVRGNIAVISHRANLLKNNATLEELIALTTWLKKVLP